MGKTTHASSTEAPTGHGASQHDVAEVAHQLLADHKRQALRARDIDEALTGLKTADRGSRSRGLPRIAGGLHGDPDLSTRAKDIVRGR